MDAGELLSHWTVYPSFLIGWTLAVAAYAAGVGPLRRRYRWAERAEPARAASFATGMVLLFLALQGPLHDLSDTYLFSAHMVQHLLITLVAPPLLLAGTPGWLLRPLLRPGWARRAVRALTRPLPAFALYNAVFTLWHVPALYDLMMRQHDVHILMHLSILGAAMLLWWPVVTPVSELNHMPYGAQILYLFLVGLPMMLLASIITLSDHLLYPFYASAPRLWGLSPEDDQQLGGLIMWVPGSMVLWIGISVAFFKWSGDRDSVEPVHRAPVGAGPVRATPAGAGPVRVVPMGPGPGRGAPQDPARETPPPGDWGVDP